MEPVKPIQIEQSQHLYRWAKFWNRKQRELFSESVILRREKQILDFIRLNGFTRVHFKIDTDVFLDHARVGSSREADLVVITDQKFSRFPCQEIINQIRYQIRACSNLYLCLNRHYLNIDNSYHDSSLDDSFNVAISQWLKKSLPDMDIVDLSLDYLDRGDYFTWAIPDRHYFIRHA